MDTKNAKSVMDILPKHKTISIEMQLLKGLYETRNNFFQALQCVRLAFCLVLVFLRRHDE